MNKLAVCLMCLSACFAASARAETSVTVAPPSAFAEQLVDRLRAGLPQEEATRVAITNEITTTPCLVIPDALASTRTVTVIVAPDSRVVVCARSGAVARERSIGPVVSLDAAVVEQVATMVEATLDAMTNRDTTRSDADATRTETVGTETQTAPDNEAVAQEDAPVADPLALDPTAAASATTPPPQAAPDVLADGGVTPADDALEGFSLTFGVEPIWWIDRALTAGARVGGQRVIAPPWFWFALDLAYALPFAEQAHGLGADFSTFAVDTRLGYSVPLNATWTFDVAAGPRVEWLFVQPFAVSGSGASAGKSSTIFAAAATVDVGPRVQVASRWFVALRVGAVFVNQPRAFGFTAPDGFVTILDQAMPRVFARLEARVAL